ncbi:hypothetical protein [Aureimonas altamirensis]|uniref:hypothetical protein n=1 Tax=Aureimonas altamirensis TaxID=370622 RepID=UPI002555FDB4|nr:hypothetical protein [Aureimonas altamirensis]
MSTKIFKNQKLSEEAVSETRELLALGVPCSVIARKFSVTTSAIHAIKTGRSWRPETTAAN